MYTIVNIFAYLIVYNLHLHYTNVPDAS